MFTGMLLVNLFYWGTAQHIMQRALAAKNLKEGQKGLIIAAFLKLLGPAFLIIPGIIAFNIFGPGLPPMEAYPKLVNHVLPTPLVGLFAAVFISIYAVTQLVWDTGLHYLHILAILFVLCSGLMFIIGKIAPKQDLYVLEDQKAVDLTPWKLLYPMGIAAVLAMLVVYALFSPIGIAS